MRGASLVLISMAFELGEVDRGIPYLLQRDARRITTEEMGDVVDVSASTVRNRIDRLEQEGVIRGYHADVAYDTAGLQLQFVIVCDAPNERREQLSEQAREIQGILIVFVASLSRHSATQDL